MGVRLTENDWRVLRTAQSAGYKAIRTFWTEKGIDTQVVRLPLCASETGMPQVIAGPEQGYSYDWGCRIRSEKDLLEYALQRIRRAGIDYHGRDLLPDADDPGAHQWRLVPVDGEHAVYHLESLPGEGRGSDNGDPTVHPLGDGRTFVTEPPLHPRNERAEGEGGDRG